MSERAAQLHGTADAQIAEPTDLVATFVETGVWVDACAYPTS